MSGGTTVKIVLVGESSVGKTALLRRFTEHSFAPDSFKATIGADFKSKKVKVPDCEEEVSLQIWDTAGQERFRSISNTYYRGCEGAMVVYDVSSRASFDKLSYWIEELLRGTGRAHLEGFSVFVVGNKVDIPLAQRQVKTSEAQQWCQSKGLSHLEVSAKDGQNVAPAFLAIAASALDYRENMSADMKELLQPARSTVVVNSNTQKGTSDKKKKSCCP